MNYIQFNTQKAELFVSRYNEANNSGKTEFVFVGDTFLVSYARYMIEHFVDKGLLDGEFMDGKSFWITNLN